MNSSFTLILEQLLHLFAWVIPTGHPLQVWLLPGSFPLPPSPPSWVLLACVSTTFYAFPITGVIIFYYNYLLSNRQVFLNLFCFCLPKGSLDCISAYVLYVCVYILVYIKSLWFFVLPNNKFSLLKTDGTLVGNEYNQPCRCMHYSAQIWTVSAMFIVHIW